MFKNLKVHTQTFVKLEFTKDSHDAILKLAAKAGCRDIRETCVKAFTVLEYLLDAQVEGRQVIVEAQDGTRERLEPIRNQDVEPEAKS